MYMISILYMNMLTLKLDTLKVELTKQLHFYYTLKHYKPVLGPGFFSTSPNWVRSKTDGELWITAATRSARQPNLQIKWIKLINKHESQKSKFKV